jgi:2'-5' RNA ligase
VTPPPAARDHLAAALAPLAEAEGAPRWTPPHRWHLTLLFLGTVPAERVDRLAGPCVEAVAPTPPTTLRLAGAGRFGSARRPQVFWAGLAGDLEPLAALARRLRRAARGLGLEVERRPFQPHLTLGRWRPGRPADGTLPDRLAGYAGPAWPVTEVELLESRLGPDPAYTRVAAWPVRGV